MPRKEGRAPFGLKKSDIEYPFEHCEVLNFSLDDVLIHQVNTNIQVSFLTQLLEMKDTAQGSYREVNVDFKTVTQFNGCDRKKLRMDQ
jgi:hypothetical protein